MLWDLSLTAASEQPAEVWQERHSVWEKLGGCFQNAPCQPCRKALLREGLG